ncbi:MAG: enoyl-CoA hydratase/isomerase family protein [Nitrososphaerota archaeon]
METYSTILYELSGDVARITLNRPEKRNALNRQMRAELMEALRRVDADRNTRMLVISGAGGNFCSGADLEEMLQLTALEIREYHKTLGTQRITAYIQEMSKVVVAAVDGYCLGGGCELMLGCDLAVASSRAVFGQPEVRVGLTPGGGGTQRLSRLVGFRRAKEIMMMGRLISAEEAERLGMVNYVVEAEKLDEKVSELLSELRSKSDVILSLIKRAVNMSLETTLSAGLEMEKELHYYTWHTEDRQEGITAFLERRKPSFHGR